MKLTTHPFAAALVLLALLPAAIAAPPAAATTLYVSPQGNDAWSGTLVSPNGAKTDGPLATLAQARNQIRLLRKAGSLGGGVTVYVRGGTYSMPQGLKFEAQDGGTEAAPVVYRAYEGERPVLVGGRVVTGFVPYQGQILKADLSAQGLRDANFHQLIFDGRRQHLARWPNFDAANPYGGGWAYADGKPIPMYQDVPGEDRRSLVYRQQDARNWARPEEVEVFVFPRYNWWNNIVRVKSVDREARRVTLAGDASYAIRPGDRYYFQNALEELDSPGEWYLDRHSHTLYFWPPAPLEGKVVAVPTTGSILQLAKGTSYLTIRGLTIECCEHTAVVLDATRHCLIAGNTIRKVGDYQGCGVAVNGGDHNGVVGNDISETGSSGVSLSGGDRKTLTPAENYADNNYIHHVGVFYKQGVGVAINGVGNRATHNLIHDGPRMGIMFSGNNLLMEYNHIRHMNLETEDTGAVYTGGRDWISSRGTVVRYNYFHDILGFGKDEKGRWVSPHFAWGVYLDDNTGGVDVIGNIVVRCPRAGIHLHNGRDNHIENNIFIDATLQQIECSGWTAEHRFWTTHLPTMIQGFEMVRDQPAWQAMRNMRLDPRDAVLADGTIMSGNQFQRNIVCYRQPKAKYVSYRNFSFDHNPFDANLVWHYGQRVLTGCRKPGRDISGNLAPNPGFQEGKPGALPADWQWQIRPTKSATAALVADHASGRRALRIDAALVAEKPRDNYPIVVSKGLPLLPGHSYRLGASMKATTPKAKASLMLQSYVANAYFWANSPNAIVAGSEWKDYEFVLTIPGPGEPGYNARMKDFRIRVDFPDAAGSLLVRNVTLREVETLDEWKSWQAAGMDRHSLVADPRFVAAKKDDYRLRPDSPAWKLGFQAIPVEKIGPYQDELRASWPIVEAEGAREKPLISQSR